MPKGENPIVCGRRNCAACGRWKHAVDFKWRWSHRRTTRGVDQNGPGPKTRKLKSRYKTPKIDLVCLTCRREQERDRYRGFSDKDKRRVYKRVNKAKQLRQERWEKEIHYARMAHDARRKAPVGDESVDFAPFRMWLLGMIRRHGTMVNVAEIAGLDEKMIRRWANGYDWVSGCDEPTPIHSIRLSTIDAISVALDDVGLLNRLYPYVDPDSGE